MAWSEQQIKLQYRLAELFPESENAKMIATQSGLAVQNIEHSGQAFIYWFNIIQEAKNQSKVDEMIEMALRIYPNDSVLNELKNTVVDAETGINTPIQKQFCIDLIEQGQAFQSIPFLMDVTDAEDLPVENEIELINKFADFVSAKEAVAIKQTSKRAKKLKSAKDQLILTINAL